ncbi:Hypothetical predicted protein [Olea europaea subsp. europaea]|uniref:Uncharacterized protein n=1 Tax=Olea europaea subsp. europaea TaxID=158383 RepID=A0A8S0REC8_OLEEU|nr:Hypothetical predicted protein [Olea europaea subsp. europaea]
MPSYQVIGCSLEKCSGTGGWKGCYKQFNFMCSPADSKQNDGNEKSVLMEAALVIRVVQIMYNRMKKLQMEMCLFTGQMQLFLL